MATEIARLHLIVQGLLILTMPPWLNGYAFLANVLYAAFALFMLYLMRNDDAPRVRH